MPRLKKCPVDIQKELEVAVSSSSSFQSVINHLSKNSGNNAFQEYYRSYSESQDEINRNMREAIFEFAKQPLFIAFLTFVKEMRIQDQNLERNVHILIKEGFLPFLDEKGNIYSIASVRNFHHVEIIEKIRLYRDLSLESRESLVGIYVQFTKWLEKETFDYVGRAFDLVRLKSQNRAIDYSMFIKFLTHLDEKTQIVAKLLYFGGSKTLNEVLSLDVKDIDFETCMIHFASYPPHVFGDIAALLQGRSSGRLFLGRQNAPLNPATIFRNFKEAGSKVGLGDSFSPKSLTTSL